MTTHQTELNLRRDRVALIQAVLKRWGIIDQFQPEDRARLEKEAPAVIDTIMTAPYAEAAQVFLAFGNRVFAAVQRHQTLCEKEHRRIEAMNRALRPVLTEYPGWTVAECIEHLRKQLAADPAARHEPQPDSIVVHDPGNA
jgi:hypothetical protein